jgi:YHS domain-containing protein
VGLHSAFHIRVREDSTLSITPTIDPVCGMRVDPARAADKREHRGTTYHFCSAWCARRFDDDADAYIMASRLRGDNGVIEDPHP